MHNILIVEDEIVVAKDLKGIITAMGHNVIGEAVSGSEAVRLAHEHRPDLILMDIKIAGDMDGIATAAKITEHYDIPIIYVTAYADSQLLERAKITKPYGYVLKPFEPRELELVVEIALYKNKISKEKAEMESRLRQAQKMEAIATFAGGILHEFNNLLMAIIGFTEITLLEMPQDSPYRANLQIVLYTGEKAKNLAARYITFSHQSVWDRKLIQFGQAIEDSLVALINPFPVPIEIKKNITSLEGTVFACADHLQLLLKHLFDNAIYAMRQKGGVLEVTLEEVNLTEAPITPEIDLPPGPYFKLIVTDTGEGMSPATMDRMFEPFFTTQEFGKGKGLGLSMIYGIVKGHDGDIGVSSQAGRGTTVTILLPRKKI